MVGFSIRVFSSPGLLSVKIPSNAIGLSICLFWFLLFFVVRKQTTTPRGRRNGLLGMVLPVIAVGAFLMPASVTLDRQTGTARVFTSTFFLPHWRTMPLGELSRAEIHQADFATAILLVTRDGAAHQLTPYSQMSGAEEAVDAINEFLRSAHP